MSADCGFAFSHLLLDAFLHWSYAECMHSFFNNMDRNSLTVWISSQGLLRIRHQEQLSNDLVCTHSCVSTATSDVWIKFCFLITCTICMGLVLSLHKHLVRILSVCHTFRSILSVAFHAFLHTQGLCLQRLPDSSVMDSLATQDDISRMSTQPST